MTVRLQIDLSRTEMKHLEQTMTELGIATKKDLFNTAIALLEWAAQERKRGRVLASVDEEHSTYKELFIPVLQRIEVEQPNSGRSSTLTPSLVAKN